MCGGSSLFESTVLTMYKWANLKPLEGLSWSVLSLTVFLCNIVRLFLSVVWDIIIQQMEQGFLLVDPAVLVPDVVGPLEADAGQDIVKSVDARLGFETNKAGFD